MEQYMQKINILVYDTISHSKIKRQSVHNTKFRRKKRRRFGRFPTSAADGGMYWGDYSAYALRRSSSFFWIEPFLLSKKLTSPLDFPPIYLVSISELEPSSA